MDSQAKHYTRPSQIIANSARRVWSWVTSPGIAAETCHKVLGIYGLGSAQVPPLNTPILNKVCFSFLQAASVSLCLLIQKPNWLQ